MTNKSILKRLLAILGIFAILACIITTLLFAVTGNKNFMGMLLITLMLPILLWTYMFIYKLIKDRSKDT